MGLGTSGQTVYNWFRYYDNQTGRYISSDPMGISAGANYYSYLSSKVIVNSDPLGLCNCEALMDLVNFEANNGKSAVLDKYDTFNRNGNLVDLNDPCESINGVTDIDWMLRVAHGAGTKASTWILYFGAKIFWNTSRGILSWAFQDGRYPLGYESLFHDDNWNAAKNANKKRNNP